MSDIIDIEKARAAMGQKAALTVERSASFCRHWKVAVDENSRIVKCQECEAPLDPVSVLGQYARRERSFVHTSQMAKDEAENLRKTVAELKRQERNARARLKRLEKKIGE